MQKTISFDSASKDFSKLKEASLLVQTTVQALGSGERSFAVTYDKSESGTKITIDVPAPVEAKPSKSETVETVAAESSGQPTEAESSKSKRSK